MTELRTRSVIGWLIALGIVLITFVAYMSSPLMIGNDREQPTPEIVKPDTAKPDRLADSCFEAIKKKYHRSHGE